MLQRAYVVSEMANGEQVKATSQLQAQELKEVAPW